MSQPTSVKVRPSATALVKAASALARHDHHSTAIKLFRKAAEIDANAIFIDWGITCRLKKEGRASLAARMDDRLQIWYRERRKPFCTIADLSHKMRMRNYIEAQGIPLPKLYAHAARL